MKNSKGITLIALIITIIVMLILVAVTINVAINGGLFDRAKKASESTQLKADREQLLSAVVYSLDANTGVVNRDKLAADLGDKWQVTGDGPYIVTSPKGNVFTVATNGDITVAGISENGEDNNSGEDVQTYTVSFNTDGGSSVESQTVASGGHATEPATNPTKEGYTFKGWYTSSSGNTLFDFANTAINSNTTIYAQWEEEEPALAITGKIYLDNTMGMSFNFMQTDGLYFLGVGPYMGNIYAIGTYMFNEGTNTITVTNAMEQNGTTSTYSYDPINDAISADGSTFQNSGAFNYSALKQSDAEFNGLYRRERNGTNGTYEYVLIQYTADGNGISCYPLDQTFTNGDRGNSASEWLSNSNITYDVTNKTIKNGNDTNLYEFVETIY